jgi:hypothetical protein
VAIPQFMLARDSKIVADDPIKITFTKQQVADDPPTGAGVTVPGSEPALSSESCLRPRRGSRSGT